MTTSRPGPAASPPPRWYPDPHDPSRLRYWDGSRWTEHTQAYPEAIPDGRRAFEAGAATFSGNGNGNGAGGAAARGQLDATASAQATERTVSIDRTPAGERTVIADRAPPIVVHEPPPARSRAGVWLLGAGLALAGAGAVAFFVIRDRDSQVKTVPSSTTTIATSSSSRPVPSTALPSSTAPATGSTTSGPAPTASVPTTVPATTSAPASTVPVPAGTKVVDTNGSYQFVLPNTWEESKGSSTRIWFTGKSSAQFRDNVNVISEKLPSDLTAADYMKLSIDNAPKVLPSFNELARSTFVVNGRQVAQVDYRSNQGGVALRHRALIVVKGRNAVTITYTTQPERFDADIASVQPYLQTIEAL